MAKYVPTAITYQESGLVKDKDAFVLSDDAYQDLENIYQWRGRLRRRPGYELLGRLRRNIAAQSEKVTGGGSTYTSDDLLASFRASEPNCSLAKSSVILTFAGTGVIEDDGAGGFTVTAGAFTIDTSSSTMNYVTGIATIEFTVAPPPASTVKVDYGYYPTLPVMGIPTRELDAINAEDTIVFDTKYAYRFSNTSNQFEELLSAAPTTWTGEDNNFFYGTNYWQTADNAQYYWVTNFSGAAKDPIRVYDGTSWYDFTPSTSSGSDVLFQCRILLPYKGRFVALNTFEGEDEGTKFQYPQRARWSQNGAPMSSVNKGMAPTSAEEWRSDVKGRGGYVDCPTNEHIVSAEYIRDTLIVGFESSTWILRYTGNEILPFVWERINKELGCESTFSMIAFDQGVLAVGDKAITSCNGNAVERIDESIPDEVFNIHNNVADGPLRVHGIRDFNERTVYWTFPDASTNAKFPDRVLVFNYHNQTWAIFKDSFTAFGKHQIFNDVTWGDLTDTTWEDANFSWISSKLQSQFPNIVAGNQQGFVLILNQKTANDPSLAITNIVGGASPVVLTIPDHSLYATVKDDDDPVEYVRITSILGTGASVLNNRIFQVKVVDDDNIQLLGKPHTNITAITQAEQAEITAPAHTFSVGQYFCIDQITSGMVEMDGLNGTILSISASDPDTFTVNIDSSDFSAYTSGGQIANLDALASEVVVPADTYLGCGLVDRVMGFSARSKKFNFLQGGKKTFLGHIDFLADVTVSGEISCDVFADYNDSDAVNDVDDNFFNKVFSTQIDPFSTVGKSKEWHRFFCPTDAQFFEYRLTLKERQMFCPSIVDSDVLIDAIIIYSETGGRLID